MLAVQGLTKIFGGFTAVDHVSFQVEEGEILGLIGPNGSGKSTTFNLIAGTLTATAGSVRLRGREILGTRPDAICRAGLARTFQIPRPFRRLSVLENVVLAAHFGAGRRPDAGEAQRRAEDALALVQLPGAADARVEGLGAAGLKKLELARALATRPQVLLADESLGGLDEAEMEQVADMLELIRRERGITIVWVEHIMGVLMRVVDRCVVLDHGEVIAEGLPRDIAADPAVIEVYLGADAEDVQARLASRDAADA